jgi:hypothetical protein
MELGALDADGRATVHGRMMAGLPLHPRLAHMILEAKSRGLGATACDIAALLGERDILRFDPGERDADLKLRIDALRSLSAPKFSHGTRYSIDRSIVRRVVGVAALLRRQTRIGKQPKADAAAGRLLAGAKPIGRLKLQGESPLRVFAFRARPDGAEQTVLVAWSSGSDTMLPLPPPLKIDAAFNMLGQPIPVQDGRLSTTPDPVYLVCPVGVERQLDLAPAPMTPEWKQAKPCPVVIQPVLPASRVRPANHGHTTSAYEFAPGEAVDMPLYMYNFAAQDTTAELKVTAEKSFRISPSERTVRLAPMERAKLMFRITANNPPPRLTHTLVRFAADCGPHGNSVTAMRLAFQRGRIPPARSVILKSTAIPEEWEKSHSPGKITIERTAQGGILVGAELEADDGWVYPVLALSARDRPPADIDGVAFTLTCLAGRGDFRVQFEEAGGSSYFGDAIAASRLVRGTPHRCVVLFRDCIWGDWSAKDPNATLDVNQIRRIRLGCNTEERRCRFIFQDVAWVKYAD